MKFKTSVLCSVYDVYEVFGICILRTIRNQNLYSYKDKFEFLLNFFSPYYG